MTENTNLKRRAREFAEIHNLPYATALRAVDEPLHQLRDITLWPKSRCAVTLGHFHLVGEKSVFADPFSFPKEGYELWKIVRDNDLPRFNSYSPDLTLESARRIELLQQAGVQDIWGYRELWRAKLLDGPELTPLLHHYSTSLLSEKSTGIIHEVGDRLGIYGVQVGGMLRNGDDRATLAIRQDQLQGLLEGKPQNIELPWGDWWARTDLSPRSRHWEVEAHTLITSKSRSSLFPQVNRLALPQLAIILGDGAGPAEEELIRLGVDPEDFEVRDIRAMKVDYYLLSELLKIRLDGELAFEGSTQNLIEIGEGFVEARPGFITEETKSPERWTWIKPQG